MKKAPVVLLVISFTALAVFSAWAMTPDAHTVDGNHGDCLAATVRNSDCPPVADARFVTALHFDAFRSFSTATFSTTLSSILLLLAVWALTAARETAPAIHLMPPALAANSRRRQLPATSPLPTEQILSRWLAFHENSPAFSTGR